MIDEDTQRLIAQAAATLEVRAVEELLARRRPARAEVMCAHERHRLARVFESADGMVLAVGWRRFLRAELSLPGTVSEDDNTEVVYQPRLFKLDPADHQVIPLRCQCHSYWTSPGKVLDQVKRLRPGDRWVQVSISKRRPN